MSLPNELYTESTVVVDAAGNELGTLQPEFEREDVPIDELPDHLVNAVLAAEDADFYTHEGVSPLGLLRAARVNVTAGEVRQGGSTITQQYVKYALLEDSSRTALRKVREAVMAMKLERSRTKDEILEYYLNTIYLGRGAYGVQAAAQAYFGVDARDLTLPQSALLAGFIPLPSGSDPAVEEQRPRAQERYRYVLDRMLVEGMAAPDEIGRLTVRPIPDVIPARTAAFNNAPWFLQMVEDELVARVGEEAAFSGLRVTTTLDSRIQNIAQQHYDERFSEVEATGALVTLSPATGAVVAVVGGEDPRTDQLNLATQPRQPGSTFKPFALAAFVDDGESPENYFEAPAEYVLAGADSGRDYTVRNYGGADYEPLSVREATWKSVNTVYLQLAEEVGFERIAEMAQRAGVDTPLDPTASLVLGTKEVTPLEMAEAYNTFAAEGVHREPHTITEVRRDGDVLYAGPPAGEQTIPEGVAATVTNVLQGVVLNGTGTAAQIGVPAAGKTGTTDSYGDAWFAGYTPSLTTVIWMGNRDDNSTMAGEPTGGDLPAELWGEYMADATEGMDEGEFPTVPGGLEVTRPRPAREPVDCPAGEVLVEPEDDDSDAVCVEASPEPTDEPTVEASAQPSASPSEEVEVSESPRPERSAEPSPPPSPAPAPAPSPAPSPPPSPRPTQAPAPAPAPSAPADAEEGGDGDQSGDGTTDTPVGASGGQAEPVEGD